MPAPRATRPATSGATRRAARRTAIALAGLAGLLATACGASYTAPAEVALPPEVTVAPPPTVQTRECDNNDPALLAISSYDPDLVVTPPGQFAPGSYMAQIQQSGKLRVGTSIDTQLFAAVNPATNEIEGFDVDIAKLVALAIFGGSWKDIGQRLDLQGITYAQRIPKVASGEVDLIAHTMTINCTRWQQVAFSGVYLYAGQRLLVEQGSPVTDVRDLAGQTVCVSAGGTSADEMRELEVSPPIEVIEVGNQTDCVVAFQQGQADAIRSDDTVLAGFAAQDPFAQIVGDLLTEEPYGMAISLDHPEFVSFVNAVLEDAKLSANPYPAADDGAAPPPSWGAIYDRWLRPHLGEPVASLTTDPATGAVTDTRGPYALAVYGRKP
ncbi:MAG: glutamate ABC transporter substrate-binding protein [Acidimicrobiia bacterium]